MGLLRKRGFLAAAATSSIVALYFALVAGRAVVFIATGDPVARALGFALLLFPALGAWWLLHEWRLGTAVQRMADELEADGRLPVHEGDRDSRGRLTAEAQDAVFEFAKREVELRPDDWAAWFHVGFAYDAAGDRSMARKSLGHAATLYRTRRARSAQQKDNGKVTPAE
ncbi:hypothetical protein [Demequina lutea]|uniref:Tetratricopeptide repeat-containing protein n=1 Tax=Demequina lutea TaxID=431489 RepID=A0A7Z0CID9_9MICO|nr:hypothetical protein [Demequina lutea]NYI41819.1 hypothetical protein [Demequina lutea]